MLGPLPPLPAHEPRASRILLPAGAPLATQLWMGGADTSLGEPLEPVHLLSAWVVDCANDMPAAHRDAAGLWLYAQTVRIRALNRAARAARWDLLRPPLYGPAA